MKRLCALLGIAFLTLSGCGDDGPSTPAGDDTPTIDASAPADVTEGTVVTLTGTHFGSSGLLFVNDVEATTTSWSDTSITFVVPDGLTGASITVRVEVGGATSADFLIAYTEPSTVPIITSVDPATITEGISVLVYGQNFGASGELRLDGAPVATTAWTETLIGFTVPQGITHRSVNLQVVSGGQTSTAFQVPFNPVTERQLTFDVDGVATPCWSDDGAFVYFTADGPNGDTAFYAVPFLGGDVSLLYDREGNDRFLDVQYYQGGSVLWVNDVDDATNPGGDWEIHEGIGGFNPQRYLDPDHSANVSNERFPVWSHTVRYGVDCAWTQDRQAGNSMIYVRRQSVIENLVSGHLPCFNPLSGDVMAFMRPSPTFGYDIMTISMQQDSEPELLYRDETTTLGLAWGRTGLIAYQKSGHHIWIMDDDGTNHRKLTDSNDQEAYPKFSPNGEWVAFTRLVTSGFEVFVARVP